MKILWPPTAPHFPTLRSRAWPPNFAQKARKCASCRSWNPLSLLLLHKCHPAMSDPIVLEGLRKFLLGSEAELVARHVRCSVLIVRKVSEQ